MDYTHLEKTYFEASAARKQTLLCGREPDDIEYEEWLPIISATHLAGLDAVFRAGYLACVDKHARRD